MINKVLGLFGFVNLADFFESIMRSSIWVKLSVFSGAGMWISNMVGLNMNTLRIFGVMLAIELVTGVWASLRKKEPFSASKLSRFGLKAFIWFFFIVLFQIVGENYKDTVLNSVYSSIHSFLVMYVIGIYSVSIGENVDILLGGKGEFKQALRQIQTKITKKLK